ncbi:MAG: adenylate/guanylate cyclase domain-containing protein [Treponema sp.]|nr:adenylate/guanylate cyclase domain-containing protein [Treponema sp.]
MLSQRGQYFFEINQDIIALAIASILSGNVTISTKLENVRYIQENELDFSAIETFVLQSQDEVKRVCNGETLILNASPFFEHSVLALLVPYEKDLITSCIFSFFSTERFSNVIGQGGTNETFFINDDAQLLFHPDNELAKVSPSMKEHPLLVALKDKDNLEDSANIQITFKDTDEEGNEREYLGAYESISSARGALVTTVSLDKVLEGVNKLKRNNLYLTLVILFISIIFVLVFARYAIAKHLRRLALCQEEIQDGNFDSDLINRLNTRRRDEIGILNQSTKDEQEFLSIFSRFTNKNVARLIARKEIDFEPHLKDVTIFFSDIRGFTAISDDFKNKFGENSPSHIINFLNDYMERMVTCITLSGGTIDKFEGDAIMAVWGILRDEDLSFESLSVYDPKKKEAEKNHLENVKSDALNAIRGTIAMRYALMKYNKDAAVFTKQHLNEKDAPYKPNIKIGCGLNTGRATCGIMGSTDKMEYTAIGDSVNFASRIESSNKLCGTDILISEDTYNLLKMSYIKCPENNFTLTPECAKNEIVVERIPVEFEVKGKGAQHFYGVVNMPQFDIYEFFSKADSKFELDFDCSKALGQRGPKTLNEVRTLLGIPIPDFEKVNLNEEENKIQVKQ